MSNGNNTLKDLESGACAYGIASRAVQEERDSTAEKRLDKMEKCIWNKLDLLESRILKIWMLAVPNLLTLLGIIYLLVQSKA